jgi:hypothetical protein
MAKFFLCIPVLAILLASCTTTAAPRRDSMVADIDPIPAGTIEAGYTKMFSSRILQMEVPLTYNPRTDSVYLEFRYQTVNYRQYWDLPSREVFIAAVSRYKEDYDARNLPSGRRSRRAYGSVPAMTEWATIKFTTVSQSYPRIDLGYVFENNSPYFITTQQEAKNVLDSTANNSSIRIILYFTRTMAEDLAALFDRDYLRSLLPGSSSGTILGTPVQPDS